MNGELPLDEELFDFTWRAPAEGSEVIMVHRRLMTDHRFHEPVPVLLDRRFVSPARSYRPLVDEPNLFLRFAETEPTREGILSFANRYGRLGGKAQFAIQEAGPDDEAPDAVCWNLQDGVDFLSAEPLFVWQRTILCCAYLVQLWGL